MNKKGFTLIELIIVIAILAIIAVVIIPQFINIKQTASENVNNHNMHILQGELENYRAKNDTYPIANRPSDLLLELKGSTDGTIYLAKLPNYKSGAEAIKTYNCVSPGGTYSITFNDDPATAINEDDNGAKYKMTEGTDTNKLFK
jgi:prepilin-type N-terminal cleavage/methylation domain-containing protein